MPTVTYKCKDSGKTKKKTFAYNAIGKAQSTEFAKLMGGSKKNNPGPGEEVMSTKDKQPTMTKQKFLEQSRKSVEDFKAKNKGLKNVGKRRRATKGLKELQKTVAKGGAKGGAKRAAKKTGTTTAMAKKATAMKKAPTKKKIKHDNKAQLDAMVARPPKTRKQMTAAAYAKAKKDTNKSYDKFLEKGGSKGAPKLPSKQVKSIAKKTRAIKKGSAKGFKKADNKARADYRKAERKKRGGDMRPLIGSGRVKRAKQVVKRNKALKRK